MLLRHSTWLALVLALTITFPVRAHEADHFTVPPGRQVADLSDYLTGYVHSAIAKGVEEHNNRVKHAVESNRRQLAENLASPDSIALTINRQFPVALFLIEELDKMATSQDVKVRYPGRLVGYKPDRGVRKHIEWPLNPFNAWTCATIQAHGVELGTDKIGHFTDMGMHYYRAYRNARAAGADEAKALQEAVRLGTHGPLYSERGILGLVTAGAFSNADLVSNYMGMCFYRNLTEPVTLKGVQRPPMLVRDGDYWRIADHVRPDSDFLSWFFSDHLNEALNPSRYRNDLVKGIRKAVVAHRNDLLARYRDRNGNPWTPQRFDAKMRELTTYYGFDYGHEGGRTRMTVATVCFAKPPGMNKPGSRNADGLTPMHFAAQHGDVAALEKVLNRGGDVNARVVTARNAAAICGETPLHLAARNGRTEAVQLLMSSGADVNLRDDRGATPLHGAILYPQIVELLLARGADVNSPDQSGRTPLHWAAYEPQATPAVQLLLNRGATPEPLDREDRTPLHDAARAGHAQAVAALIRGAADVNSADRFGETPLHYAAASGAAETVDLLLRGGALTNVADQFGCTPLHVAARHRRPQAVALLLHHGADADAVDAYGTAAVALMQRQSDLRAFAAKARLTDTSTLTSGATE